MMKAPRRFGSILRLPPENYARYKELHAAVWPSVLEQIENSNIRNYSIYHWDGLLFSYFEYVGDNFEKDMAEMAKDPNTQAWWAINEPLQEPVEGRKPGEWWAGMEELFHFGGQS
jgi:L-rhamnose mutarotase